MKLSLIIPIYNAEKYLRECLESVKKLNISDLECILVNDGSKDGSLTICQEYADKNAIFKIVDKENGGVSAARNSGLKVACGDYIMFLDADDFFVDGATELIGKALSSDKEFVAFGYDTLYDDGRTVTEAIPDKENGDMYDRCMKLVYADSCFNTCWGKLFKREIINSKDILFDEGLPIGEDFKFVAEYMQYVKDCRIYDESLIFYRQHGASAMRKYDLVKRLEYNKVLYNFQTELVEHLNYDNLPSLMNNYYLRVVTNLCREFARTGKLSHVKAEMKILVDDEIVITILTKLSLGELGSLKKFEVWLLKNRFITLMAVYFRLKGKL